MPANPYDPTNTTPYTPVDLPPAQVSPWVSNTLNSPARQDAPPSVMPGAKGTGVASTAYIASNLLNGIVKGRALAQAHKTQQLNRLQSGLQTVYNTSAERLDSLTKSGETDPAKLQSARDAVDASWTALGRVYGKSTGILQKGDSAEYEKLLQEDPQQLISSENPQDKIKGVYITMIKSKAPIYNQLEQWNSPLAQQARQLTTAQTAGNVAQSQYETTLAQGRNRMFQLQNDPEIASNPQKAAELEKLRNTPGILQHPLPAPPTQLMLGDTLPAGTTDMYGQPVNAKMPYRMVNNGTAGYGYMPVAEKPVATGTVEIFDPNDLTKTIKAAQFRYPYSNRVEVRIPGPNGEGILVEHPYEVPPGWAAPKTTTHTNVDPSGFKSTGTSTVSSPTPHMTTPSPTGATPVAAPAAAPPASPNQLPPGAQNLPATPQQGAAAQHPAPVPNAKPGQTPPTQPLGMGMKIYNSLTDVGRAQVDAAGDNFWKYGIKPGQKYDKAQSVAINLLKEQGVDIPTLATAGALGQGDTAKMIDPLIAKARQLIAADPTALGPLAGRWSELSQKAGTLSGPAKELAGTLISIYSLAGKLHGWRAIQVADEFRKTYGDLTNTPASLNSGLDAMAGTTKAIEGVAYPHEGQSAPISGQGGGATPPKTPPPAASKPKNAAEYLQSIGVH